MFESPASTRPVVTLDPWSVDYGSAVGFDDEAPEEQPNFEVDAFVETEDWSAGVSPEAVALPESVAFVDGVQRVEYWARVDDGETLAEAAFASVAVGATVSESGRATMTCEYASHVFSVTGPIAADPQVVPSRNGPPLVYEVARGDGADGHRAVLQAIAIKRRDLEHECVRKLIAKHPLVIADGRIDRPEAWGNQLAGVAKTLHQLYLKGEQRALIARLAAGQRTPLFEISDSWGARFSWFVRLPYTRAIHHSYAGIVRLEVPVAGTVGPPVRVADMLTHNLPRFASKPEHDPRAPQNLLPVGALERQLRHELGDARYIRRLIEDHVSGRSAR